MKNIFTLVFIFSSLITTVANAQHNDSWKIYLNKKLLLQTPVESNQPTIWINKSATQSKNTISIQYKSDNTENNFKRSFFINDEQEKTYKTLALKNNDGTVTFNAKDLKALAASNKPLFIYTTAIPKDPALAAVVRVRRYLLCKIEWK